MDTPSRHPPSGPALPPASWAAPRTPQAATRVRHRKRPPDLRSAAALPAIAAIAATAATAAGLRRPGCPPRCLPRCLHRPPGFRQGRVSARADCGARSGKGSDPGRDLTWARGFRYWVGVSGPGVRDSDGGVRNSDRDEGLRPCLRVSGQELRRVTSLDRRSGNFVLVWRDPA